jgi:hypothetical protein
MGTDDASYSPKRVVNGMSFVVSDLYLFTHQIGCVSAQPKVTNSYADKKDKSWSDNSSVCEAVTNGAAERDTVM